MEIGFTLEEDCGYCHGAGGYWDYNEDKIVECDCVDGVRLTAAGREIIDLVDKYTLGLTR